MYSVQQHNNNSNWGVNTHREPLSIKKIYKEPRLCIGWFTSLKDVVFLCSLLFSTENEFEYFAKLHFAHVNFTDQ